MLHEITFQKAVERANLNKYLYEQVNIREQDSWVSKDRKAATEKAIRLIRAGIAKVTRQNPLEPIIKKVVRRAVVIGGGYSGLISALDLANRKIPVEIIEKSPFIGGRVSQWHKLYPTEDKAEEIMKDLISKVTSNPLINIRTNTEVVAGDGSLGKYTLKLKTIPRGVSKQDKKMEEIVQQCPFSIPDPHTFSLTKRKIIYKLEDYIYPNLYAVDWENCDVEKFNKWVKENKLEEYISLNNTPIEEEIEAGALIIATGFDLYEPYKGEYGWELHKNIITLPQLIQLLKNRKESKKKLIYNDKEIKSIAMIHCVGSRQIEGENKPGKHGRINTYCSKYCCTATLENALEIKKNFQDIAVFDIYQDIRTYGLDHEDYYINASKNDVIFIRYNHEYPPEVIINDQGDYLFTIKVKDQLSYYEEVAIPADLVVLSVGMIPRNIDDIVSIFSIPVGSDGFLVEAHPKLRPVETSIGVFLAGTSQGPMDSTESASAASAAAAKVAAILSHDQLELPPFIAEIDPTKCEAIGECIKACEYGAIIITDVELPDGKVARKGKVDPSLCVGCGACIPVCPKEAINLIGWTTEQIEAMVDALIKEVEL
ncbi:MAG: CoB--CoM heterodisulfide reductase iron-sulfur subunit A family protein [Candidatus Heimdallarchaeaceae archaeon]